MTSLQRNIQMQPDYCFYATLLDAYQNYLNSDKVWEKYWGWSENPPHTLEEFQEEQFQSFINTLNRVPFDSEAADRGTAFNEVVDCLIENRTSNKINVEKLYPPKDDKHELHTPAPYALKVEYNNREFVFPLDLCWEFARYYEGAVTQQYVEALLPTKYGAVKLYGYIDELMPDCVHDIKTTSSYSVGKYKENFQHLVYPYCLNMGGCKVNKFEYNVVEFSGKNHTTYTELYVYDEERDTKRLREHCEDLICFINDNRHLITNKKIFNIYE